MLHMMVIKIFHIISRLNICSANISPVRGSFETSSWNIHFIQFQMKPSHFLFKKTFGISIYFLNIIVGELHGVERAIQQGAAVDARGDHKLTALHKASRNGN